MRRNRGEHGSGLIEFIFVAPIILLLAGSTLEVARFLRFRQIAGVLSQEAANRAYSQCADITSVSVNPTTSKILVDEPTTIANIQTCLTNIKKEIDIAAKAAGLQEGRALTISVYRHNLGTVAPELNCSSPASTKIDRIDPASTVTTSGGATTTDGAIVVSSFDVCKRGRIVIAELVFRYTTIINYRVFGLRFNTNLKQSGFERNDLRETTIL